MGNYEENKAKYEEGRMLKIEWMEYCIELLIDLMEENRDILERMKNN